MTIKDRRSKFPFTGRYKTSRIATIDGNPCNEISLGEPEVCKLPPPIDYKTAIGQMWNGKTFEFQVRQIEDGTWWLCENIRLAARVWLKDDPSVVIKDVFGRQTIPKNTISIKLDCRKRRVSDVQSCTIERDTVCGYRCKECGQWISDPKSKNFELVRGEFVDG